MEYKEVEQLRKQAIEAEERRIEHILTFLDDLPLNTDVNKSIALELGTVVAFIRKNIKKLQNLKYEKKEITEDNVGVGKEILVSSWIEELGNEKAILLSCNFPVRKVVEMTQDEALSEVEAIIPDY